MSSEKEFRRRNTRKAAVVQVGGFRPTGDPFASNFGLPALGLPTEEWPNANGTPMLFVCQLNLTTAPAIPPSLADLKLLTFFVEPEFGDLSQENHENWCLRAYKSLQELAPIPRPPGVPVAKRGFECRWEECDDHPNYDDSSLIEIEGFDSADVELENVARTKIGGYVSSIHSEPWWALEEHPAAPAYCLQIASEEKAGMVWGDGGILYIARGTSPGMEHQWFLDWQCY